MRKRSFAPFILAFFALTLGSCISSPGGGVTPASDSYFDLDFEAFLSENNIRFLSKSFVYDGEYHSLEIEGNLPEEYKVWYEGGEQKDVGEYEVFARFDGPGIHYVNQYVLRAYMTISPAMVDESQIVFEDATYVYDGDLHMIEIARPYPDGIVSVDYDTHGYVDAGDYEITAHFQVDGNHAPVADKTARLTILPYEVDMSEVVFEDKTVTYDGYTHAIYAEHLPLGVDVNYEGNHKWEAGIYQVTANFTAPRNAAPIDPMHAVLTIEQAPFDLSSVSFPDQEARYDGNPHAIEVEGKLPAGVLVEYENNDNVDVGVHEVTAHFAWDEDYADIDSLKRNYLLPEDLSAQLTIVKGIAPVSFPDGSFEFDEAPHSIFIQGDLPEGMSVEYSNNEHSDLGEYEVTAHFSGENPRYECPEDMTATLYIHGESAGLVFEKDFHGKEYYLTGYEPVAGSEILNIPATHNGLPVTSCKLGESAGPFPSIKKIFVHGKMSLRNAPGTFPNAESVHFYGDYSELGCVGAGAALKEVYFGGKVTALSGSFVNCTGLESIVLPEGLETIEGSFCDCTSLSNVVLPSSLLSVGRKAFLNCCELKDMPLPSMVADIQGAAFAGCSSLGSVSFGSALHSMGYYAFENCASLKRVNSSVDGVFDLKECTSIEDYCFNGCSGMEVLRASNLQGTLLQNFNDLPSLRSVSLGDGVTEIRTSFNSTPVLEEFNGGSDGQWILPANLTRIESSFNDSSKVKTIAFGNDLIAISASFCRCSSLSRLILPSTVLGWSNSFQGSPLTHVELPSIEKPSNWAADYAIDSTVLQTVVMPAWLLGEMSAEALASIENLTLIGEAENVPNRCVNLKTLTLENPLKKCSLDLPKLEELHVGARVESIKLGKLPSLKRLVLDPENPYLHSDGILVYNKEQTKIISAVPQAELGSAYADFTVPENVTEIDQNAFCGATWLRSVSIAHAAKVSDGAFSCCANLEEVNFGEEVIPGNDLFTSSPVRRLNTQSMTQATAVAETLEWLRITDGPSKPGDLPEFPKLKEAYFVGNGVYWAEKLIPMADSLTKFRAIDLPDENYSGIPRFKTDEQGGLYSFWVGSSLSNGYRLIGVSPDLCPKDFVAPRTKEFCLFRIGQKAFRNCNNLESFVASGIGNEVFIEEEAFARCASLAEVHIEKTGYVTVKSEAFRRADSLVTFTCTNSTISYSNIKIEENAFHECPSLQMVQLEAGPTSSLGPSTIYSYAFNDCYALWSTLLSNMRLMSHAFHECPAIRHVSLRSLVSIEADSYENVSAIKTIESISYNRVLSEPSGVGDILTGVTTVKSEGLLAYYLAGFTSVTTYTMEALPSGKSTYDNVGAYACAGCANLRNVFLLEGIRTIEERAFQNCASLGSFTIPASVRTLGEGVFEGCTSLQTLNYDGTMEQWESMTKGENWKGDAKFTKVYCSDGEITL